jgi:hypothetical protein
MHYRLQRVREYNAVQTAACERTGSIMQNRLQPVNGQEAYCNTDWSLQTVRKHNAVQNAACKQSGSIMQYRLQTVRKHNAVQTANSQEA